MPKRIEKLSLRGFRGATTPVEIIFDTNRPIVMIFGENGTGKSTIVDAIDFVCNAQYGSLEDRSGVSKKIHVCTVNGKAKDLIVDVTCGEQTWSGRLGKDGPQITGPDARPQAKILRRHKILQVVEETAGNRYKALQDFLSPVKIAKIEDQLRKAYNQIAERYNEATHAAQQARESLEKLWQAEGATDTSYLDWAQRQAQQTADELQATVKAVNDLLAPLEPAASALQALRTAQQQHSLNLDNAGKVAAAMAEVEAKAQTNDRQKELIDLLQKAQAFLRDQQQLEYCPVCLKPNESSELQQLVEARLQEMRELVALKRALDEAQRQAQDSEAVLRKAETLFVQNAGKLLVTVRQSQLSEADSLRADVSEFVYLTNSEMTDLSLAIDEGARLLDAAQSLRAPLAANRDAASKKAGQLAAIKNHLEIIAAKTAEAARLERQKARLAQMLGIVERCRKDYTNGFLDEISSTVESYYRKLHPDEPIGNFRFFLKEKVIGSLEFTGTFADASEVPPQAYYSESHLDTLGICVFLGMVKHTRNKDCIVVLDDVLTSVDNSHLHRFIEMLQEVANDFSQLILTTHYRYWYDRFKRRGGGNLQFIELSSWSLLDGLRPAESNFEITALKQMLARSPFPRQEITAKAGVMLEHLFDALALHYGFKGLPRMDSPRYTLSQLLDAAMKPSKLIYTEVWPEAATAATRQVKLEPLVKGLKSLVDIRNEVGAHFNPAGADWSDADVRQFAELTIQVAETLLCSQCGEMPARNRSGSWWQCSCQKHQHRLYPLSLP
ncbi:MAG: AAA family ATPase [Blastocatellales bacterium]